MNYKSGTPIISLDDFKKLKKQGRVGAKKKGQKAKEEMYQILHDTGLSIQCEFKFHPIRKYKFDFAIPSKQLAFEYEGLLSEKSGHTTVKGYTANTEKYNLATCEGWKVLRYTALNWQNIKADLKKLI